MENPVPENADVVGGRKLFKTAANSVGRQTPKKRLANGSRKKSARRLIPTNLQNKLVGRKEFLSRTFCIDHVNQFWVPASGGSFWKPCRDSHCSWRCLFVPRTIICPTTSLDENFIEIQFQTDRNYYVDLKQTYLALELKFSSVVVTKLIIPKQLKKSINRSKTEWENGSGGRRGTRSSGFSCYTNSQSLALILFHFWSVHQQRPKLKSNLLSANKAYNSNSFKEAIFVYKGVLHCEGYH